MHPARFRTLGFLIPTTLIVTGQHLAKEFSAGEALDGVVASLFFTTLFFLGSIVARSPSRRGHGFRPRSNAREFRAGLLTGVLAWALLWTFWAVPPTRELRELSNLVFPFNCVWMMLAGALARPRPPGRSIVAA